MRKTFPSYTPTAALGPVYGDNLWKSIKEFQRRVGLKQDGCTGPATYDKLKQYGFKYKK
jgi:murein L,D-transpeptidase YcbB/YkuD